MSDFETIAAAPRDDHRRRFAAVQAAKAGIGLLLATAFVALLGRPDAAEAIAIGGLLAPAALAPLAWIGLPLAALETASLALFAGLVAYMAFLTGGLLSPLVVWFALVPAEAALAGDRTMVLRATVVTIVALIALAALHALKLAPAFSLFMPLWALYGGSAIVAVLQAAFIAVAAQERQRAADMALAEGAAMYRFLADNAMDMITRHSADGVIRFASPAAQSVLGRTPQSLAGLALATLVHPDDLSIMQSAMVDASYLGHAATAEMRMRRADGTYIWTEIRCRPAHAVEGKAADIVAVTRDISERKAHEGELVEARDSAEQANRAKSRFLANMSHELRTPLNAIIGFSEVMTREMFGPVGSPRYLEYAKVIHESGGHLLELINGILDMSKIEAGKFELTEEIFDLEEVAAQAVRFVKLQSDRKGVALRIAIAPDAKAIFADKRAVKQMLVNLISNGVKFTPRGGEVRFAALRQGAGLVLAVSDTGVGIGPEDMKRLGRPFEQVETAYVRSQEGTGLGLALVKALAHLHQGELTVRSALGEGTTVCVRLPSAAVDETGERAALKGAA